MSRFLDQIRKAKEARQRAERERQATGDQKPGPDNDPEAQDTLVPEPEPNTPEPAAEQIPEPPTLDDDTDKELFPTELQQEQEKSETAPDETQDPTPDEQEGPEPLFPEGIENTPETPNEKPDAAEPLATTDFPAELETHHHEDEQPQTHSPEPPPDTLPAYESIENAADQARQERQRQAQARREHEQAETTNDPEAPDEAQAQAPAAAAAPQPDADPLDNIVEKLEKRLASRQPAAPPQPTAPQPTAPTPPPQPGELRESPQAENEDLFPSELNHDSDIDEAKAASAVGFFAEGAKDHTRERYERKRRRRLRQEVTLDGPPLNDNFIKRIPKVAPDPDPRALCFWDPKNHICEEYRLLGKNIIHAFADDPSNGRRGRVVSLSSSVRGEGKTLTIVNLVLALAQDLHDRIVVVDGDLRNPKVHKYLGTTSRAGLNNMLEAPDPAAILEDSLVRTDLGLHMLLSKSSGDSSPAPILDTERMTAVLELLRDHYSLIILDTPPVLLATDALSLGVKSDGMLFLLRARKTQREMIQEARQRIARLDINLMGYVINNVKSFLPRIWKYGRYYYGRYSNY